MNKDLVDFDSTFDLRIDSKKHGLQNQKALPITQIEINGIQFKVDHQLEMVESNSRWAQVKPQNLELKSKKLFKLPKQEDSKNQSHFFSSASKQAS